MNSSILRKVCVNNSKKHLAKCFIVEGTGTLDRYWDSSYNQYTYMLNRFIGINLYLMKEDKQWDR